ncbi:MAG: hypothetical protein ACFFEO_06210 [Candidatus Thorarchaeota archaeon]
MKRIENIEKLAQHNQNLANHESELAKKEKHLAKKLKLRTKARKILIKKELEIAEIRKSLAKKNQELVNKKLEISQENIINFPETLLKHEKDYTLFNEKLAENLIDLSKLSLKVTDLEEVIANKKEKLAENNLKIAKIRNILAKQQYKYAQALKSHPNNQEIVKMEMDYLNTEKDLKKIYNDRERDTKDLIKKKEELTDLSKKISLNLAERENIRLHDI